MRGRGARAGAAGSLPSERKAKRLRTRAKGAPAPAQRAKREEQRAREDSNLRPAD